MPAHAERFAPTVAEVIAEGLDAARSLFPPGPTFDDCECGNRVWRDEDGDLYCPDCTVFQIAGGPWLPVVNLYPKE